MTEATARASGAGRWLIVLACAAHLVIYLVAAPEHVVATEWPAHARFHVLEAICWAAGLDLAIAAIAWVPLARGERWAWWAAALGFVTGHASYFGAIAALPAGRPPNLSADVTLGLAAALFALGLVLTARPERQA